MYGATIPVGAIIKMNEQVAWKKNVGLVLQVKKRDRKESGILYLCIVLETTPHAEKKVGEFFSFGGSHKADIISLTTTNRSFSQYCLGRY